MLNPLDDTKVYTLADLKEWEKLRPGLPPSLAVIGHPVAHSVSPQMHNAALAELAKKYPVLREWRYFKFDIAPEELEEALKLLGERKFKGTNVTVPHKEAVALIFGRQNINIDGVVEGADITNAKDPDVITIDPEAFHAANTVVYSSKRRICNTDGYGMIQAIKRDLKIDFSNRTIVILGAGGAVAGVGRASELADELLDRNCNSLWIGSRAKIGSDEELGRLKLLKNLREHLNFIGTRKGLVTPTIHGFSLSEPPVNRWPEDVIVINATTLGMKRNDPLPIDVKLFSIDAKVFDMVYNRKGPTQFVVAARARGLRAADGLGMLIWQGAKSLSIWINAHEGINIKPEDIAQTMMDAACKALGRPHQNA
jgi:shikimate dehydrogenase